MTETKEAGTQIRSSQTFADLILELARDSGTNIREFIDKHYLPDVKRKHERMLKRKLAAHGSKVGA